MNSTEEKLIAIVGPTAVGKSGIAIRLAEEFRGEIVNADSRQIYRHMDIGTAKPTPDEFSRVPHHLFDIIDPDETFSLADYKENTVEKIRRIISLAKVPFLVGGSGQYAWAVLENWQIPRIPPDLLLRDNLEKRAASHGTEALYRELQKVDTVSADRIGPFNTRRIIRALEVFYTCGTPFSHFQKKGSPLFNTLIVGLTADRKTLYQKIDYRVDEMMRAGLVEEVENLLEMGYDLSLPAMSAIGYKQIGEYLQGETDRESAVSRIKFETHRYVRQQYNWFRLKDARISWFEADKNPYEEIRTLVKRFLGPEQ